MIATSRPQRYSPNPASDSLLSASQFQFVLSQGGSAIGQLATTMGQHADQLSAYGAQWMGLRGTLQTYLTRLQKSISGPPPKDDKTGKNVDRIILDPTDAEWVKTLLAQESIFDDPFDTPKLLGSPYYGIRSSNLVRLVAIAEKVSTKYQDKMTLLNKRLGIINQSYSTMIKESMTIQLLIFQWETACSQGGI